MSYIFLFHIKDTCNPNQCLNGVCSTKDSSPYFECECPPNYEGDLCDIVVESELNIVQVIEPVSVPYIFPQLLFSIHSHMSLGPSHPIYGFDLGKPWQ